MVISKKTNFKKDSNGFFFDRPPFFRVIVILISFALMSGCAALVSNATSGIAEDLCKAILNNDDPAVVADGAPAFLIILDALLSSDPDNPDLLNAAATLNSSFATAFVTNEERRSRLANKALNYSLRASCIQIRWTCQIRSMPFKEINAKLPAATTQDVAVLYALASGWAGWIQAPRSDWAAVAQLASVKAIMARVLELGEDYENGSPHMYMGVFETLFPPAMGGRPAIGRQHFERAIEISSGQYLMAKVLFAESYARLVFDRELHDRLLHEVLESDPNIEGLTLINLVAQTQARELLESANDYF